MIDGGDGDDSLVGGDGSDVLDGEGGSDTMVGGAASDSYWVDDAGDEVVEASGQGIDQVFNSISYVLTDNVENLLFIGGSGDLKGTGTILGNEIIGNEGNNVISGLEGNDRLGGTFGRASWRDRGWQSA